MKLLLDENLPHRLRTLLIGHDAFTVAYMNWKGIGNGQLLALAASSGFDAVITKDTGIEYVQNLADLPLLGRDPRSCVQLPPRHSAPDPRPAECAGTLQRGAVVRVRR
jgi:predicted nuclease of predicted toxin-antitoxin system